MKTSGGKNAKTKRRRFSVVMHEDVAVPENSIRGWGEEGGNEQ